MKNRVRTPSEQVTGVLDDPDRLDAVGEALRSAGFSADDLTVIGGDSALAQVDPDGRGHGLVGRFTRALDHFGQEGEEHHAAAEEVEDGHFLVSVAVSSAEEKDRAAAALRAQGVHRLRFWGRFSIESLSE